MPAVRLIEGDADQHRTGNPDDPGAGGPAENAGGRLLRARALTSAASRAGSRPRGRTARRRRSRSPAQRPDRSAVVALRAMPDRSPDEAARASSPRGRSPQREQHLPERLMRDGVHRALLVRQLAAVTERELERQDPDDPVDQAPRHEPRAREVLEGAGMDESRVRPPVASATAAVELGLMRRSVARRR